MPIDPSEFLNIEEARLNAFDPSVSQNRRNELYFNPRAMAALDSTVVTPQDAVGFQFLSDTELAIYFKKRGSDNAVPFRRAKNLRTGSFSFGPVIALRPMLRAPKGKQIRYPYRIDLLEGGDKRFVLLLGELKLVPVTTRQRTAKVR